jgi:YjbE family integral membrane protein
VSSLLNLAQIALIDLSLAGDNALMVGLAVASLPPDRRKRAMALGIGSATVLRILLALFAVQLLQITGLLVAGGLILAWVAWKMLREIRHLHRAKKADEPPVVKKFAAAVWQILAADISMSLDNVLGVAGIARDDRMALVAGLTLSVLLMALASSQIAKLTARYPKAGYVGIAVILYTALRMIYDGAETLYQPIHAFA